MKVKFKNTEVFYSKTGQGPVIVWLHGFLESKEIWTKQKAFFNSKFTNVCIDLLGHGKTGCIGEVHSMELQAEAVKAVIEDLGIDKFSIVGHSMGGYIGLALVEKLGDRITHFVLLNSTSNPDSEEKKANRERAVKIVSQQKDSFVRMGVVNLFSETNRKRFSQEIEAIIKGAKNMSNQAIIAALMGMKNRPSRTTVLKNYSGHKLIICGKEDPVISIETSKEESQMVGSTIVYLEGGHMSYLEALDMCNKGLLRLFI